MDRTCEKQRHAQEPFDTTNCSNIQHNVDHGCGDVTSQTRSNSGCNSDRPNSLTEQFETSVTAHGDNVREPLHECTDFRRTSGATSKASSNRNPITGLGLDGDGVGGWKPIKPKSHRGEAN